MGKRMTTQDWTEYRTRASRRVRPDGSLNSHLRCPGCGGQLLKAVSITLYPCIHCGMGWYPVDINFSAAAVEGKTDG